MRRFVSRERGLADWRRRPRRPGNADAGPLGSKKSREIRREIKRGRCCCCTSGGKFSVVRSPSSVTFTLRDADVRGGALHSLRCDEREVQVPNLSFAVLLCELLPHAQR